MPDARYTFGEAMSDKDQLACESPSIGSRSGTGYIWMAYSVFFFVDPIMRRSLRFWLVCVGIYAVFLAVYIGYMRARSTKQRYVLLAAFYVLGMVSLPINSSSTAFFVYSAAFLPFAVASVPTVIAVMVAQCLGVAVQGLVMHVSLIPIAITIFMIIVVGTSNIFVAQQKRSQHRLRVAHDEIERLAALAERERIARDLHDVLGHTLSVIVLKSELAGRLVERDPQRAAQEIGDVEKTARTALKEVREAIGGYRSQGLAAEVEMARNTLQTAGVAMACESPVPKLTSEEETVLCLALREAVTNIVRHAHATQCRMRFATTEDRFHSLQVEDDGPHPIKQEGNGLRGMRERVQSLGGRFSINSEHGTTLLVELPVRTTSTTGVVQ
ncbi:two-component system sensor histidine kinase DesK [Edaphobacter aggregans]|uniref:Two-component system sensor histidine kinase DesK n=2 Tax=Edaphobacter aggregans TaxID=570835 RepID=A0A428MIW6_9BACT|nr:two-component system sensor histidine kinase DesK [Edaphobacter aggregans]